MRADAVAMPQLTTTAPSWETLPADVAEWMGLDEAMVGFTLDLAG